MRVAVTSKENKSIDLHFGYTDEFHIYDVRKDGYLFIETRRSKPFCGVNPNVIKEIVNLISDCNAVITQQIGPCAVEELDKVNVTAYSCNTDIDIALNELAKSLND